MLGDEQIMSDASSVAEKPIKKRKAPKAPVEEEIDNESDALESPPPALKKQRTKVFHLSYKF
jgi:hypothetical protein